MSKTSRRLNRVIVAVLTLILCSGICVGLSSFFKGRGPAPRHPAFLRDVLDLAETKCELANWLSVGNDSYTANPGWTVDWIVQTNTTIQYNFYPRIVIEGWELVLRESGWEINPFFKEGFPLDPKVYWIRASEILGETYFEEVVVKSEWEWFRWLPKEVSCNKIFIPAQIHN